MKRIDDWFEQSKIFFQDASIMHQNQSYYLSCFLCQQSVEFALKSLCQKFSFRCWGHNLLEILEILKTTKSVELDSNIITACQVLTKYYISTRYPDAYTSGIPYKQFSEFESSQALKFCNEVIKFVEKNI